MKKNVLTLLTIILLYNPIFGQNWILFNFEQDTNCGKYFYIDSADVNNIWQIGKPEKTTFTTAYSAPNALITDTTNPYPTNNVSSFILWHKLQNPVVVFVYYYYLYTDTLADFAKIESSVNGGLTWIDLTTSQISWFHQWDAMPIFSGNSKGWKPAALQFNTEYFNSQLGDTILFKFSLISDSIDNLKDGWMIDDFWITDNHGIGILENSNKENSFQIFYKGNNEIELIKETVEILDNYKIQIFELFGKQINSFKIQNKQRNIFYLPNLSVGLYFYRIINDKDVIQTGKIIIY